MFSLPRRQSMSTAASTTSPHPSNKHLPVPPPVVCSPTTTSTPSSPIFDDKDASPTCRKGNNEKSNTLVVSNLMENPLTTIIKNDPISCRDHAGESRQSIGMLKSIRSLHIDSQNQHHRTLSRDFSLPPLQSSTLTHENCSSLKDQFLKIKERFSSPSPTAKSSIQIPGANEQHTVDGGDKTMVSASMDSQSSLHHSSEMASRPVATIPTKAADQGDPTEKSLAEINENTKKFYSGDILWPQHARVERWYMEDNYFKGSMTCWTIEKGAEIVTRVANVVSKTSSTTKISPDISLQWIGRQLWAVTISLPLTRSGQLKEEHIALAYSIDEAIAAEQAQQSSSREHFMPLASAPDPRSDLERQQITDYCDSNNQVQTLILHDVAQQSHMHQVEREEVNRSDTGSCESKGKNDNKEMGSSAIRGDGRSGQHAAAASGALRRNDRAAKCSGSSMSTLLADEEEVRDGSSTSRPSNTLEEGGDTVAELPLSWSMLSLSSLPSTSDSMGISINDNDQREEDARCAPDRTGWLKKKTGLNSWQPRYFELKGNRLYYFASEDDGIPRGAIILDHAHVLRGKGENSMSFSITSSSMQSNLHVIKFRNRTSHQVHQRKSIILRVTQETEEAVTGWVTALNRASFYCNLSARTSSSASSSSQQNRPTISPGKKKKMAFYLLRSPSSSASSLDDDGRNGTLALRTLDCASVHHYGSVKYLQETDPLLWEIHPHDQLKIRKKASLARTKADYLAIFSKYNATFHKIFLPKPRPISLEQTLRDILPELLLINNILYGGGEENNGLENIFEVLDTHIKKFASAQEERVRAVSALLQACARTISGGDSYFVIHSLLGNPFMIIRPAEARGHPIEIEISPTNPCQFIITVFSAFSFHHIEDVEKYGDTCDSSGGNTSMTPEPLLRVKTYHVQEFDFGTGKSSRWLRVHTEGMKEYIGTVDRNGWGAKRDGSETRIGALLDALS